MYNVLIDPLSLVANSKDLDTKTFESYLENLIETMELKEYDFLIPFILEETISLFYGNDEYLNIFNLEKWLAEFDSKYTSKDIILAATSIMNYNVIENVLQDEKIFLNNLKAIDENQSVWGEEIFNTENLLRFSLMINRLFNGETYLKGNKNVNLKCTGEITHLGENKDIIKGPDKIEETLKGFSSIEQILMEVNIPVLWKISSEKNEFARLVEIYFKKNATHKEKITWRLGDKFFENFKKHGFYTEDRKIKSLLQAMFKAVYDEFNSDSHALRSSSSGGAPAIEGHLGKAKRISIDYEYHLHYWIKQKHVIFAWVCTHNDFYIPE